VQRLCLVAQIEVEGSERKRRCVDRYANVTPGRTRGPASHRVSGDAGYRAFAGFQQLRAAVSEGTVLSNALIDEMTEGIVYGRDSKPGACIAGERQRKEPYAKRTGSVACFSWLR
jgi:hypothetical protein